MNQALIQLPLPILLPKLDVTLAWEYFPLRGNAGPGIPGTLLPLLIPTLEPALAASLWEPLGPYAHGCKHNLQGLPSRSQGSGGYRPSCLPSAREAWRLHS